MERTGLRFPWNCLFPPSTTAIREPFPPKNDTGSDWHTLFIFRRAEPGRTRSRLEGENTSITSQRFVYYSEAVALLRARLPGAERMKQSLDSELATTGIAGLDSILHGGLPRRRVFLIQGDPGVGKTTLAMSFLIEGARLGEKCLYVSLSESTDELSSIARSHQWDLTGIDIHVQHLDHAGKLIDETNTLFRSDEVELFETTDQIKQAVEKIRPDRIVIDSLSEFRLLAQSSHRYRRHILALKQYFGMHETTVLFLDDRTSDVTDTQLHSIPHGVIELEQIPPVYGSERRRLRVVKMRGRAFTGGFHDFKIVEGGVRVFPRLIAAEHPSSFERTPITSGVGELDALLGGGVDRGTSTLLMGPAGAGKSALITQYVIAAAERGDEVALFVFDESILSLYSRSESLGLPLRKYVDHGLVHLQQIDPAEMTTGEFSDLVRREVTERGIRVLAIDSLNGYMNSMSEERNLMLHMHELLSYLGQHGVATFLVVSQHGLLGNAMVSVIDVSYLADTVILLRYFELQGEIRKAISVVKKRSGNHEKSIREFNLSSNGLHIGAPLREFQGLLTGTPEFKDDVRALFGEKGEAR